MSDSAIVVENLSKRYLIGHRLSSQARYRALRETFGHELRGLVRKTSDILAGRQLVQGDRVEEFWALRDVSFEVRQGEILGIIGRNGAGKSTLLKILSRITQPTQGRIQLRGRVASLLEVGTGFHPELTGRENIFLNGAILGMTQREIRQKFDEIVDFAEIDKFLDTPVKHYSSGMYVRLAFAVAAHLEPEILLVDEVLAVGDIQFQSKCLGKINEVSRKDGRTILFVSHNLSAVSDHCTRAMLIMSGQIAFSGSVDQAIELYAHTGAPEHSVTFPADVKRPTITAIDVDPKALIGFDLLVDIRFASPRPFAPIGGIVLRSPAGSPIWGSNGRFHPSAQQGNSLSCGVVRCEARQLPLTPGEYLLSVWLSDWHEDYDSRIDVLRIHIGTDYIDKLRPSNSLIGHINWPANWTAKAQ